MIVGPELTFFLLTHEREIPRKTSTAGIVKTVLGNNCIRITWSRSRPDLRLERELSPDNSALVFERSAQTETRSTDKHHTTTDVYHITNFILLDGTWQETRKIYNRSPYLKRYPLLELNPILPSQYTLRRNQANNGLCTAESVVETLRLKRQHQLAEKLQNRFVEFQNKGFYSRK